MELATEPLPRKSKKCQALGHFDVMIFKWFKVHMKMTKRSTVYFDSDLYKALRIKAAQYDKSLSELINQVLTFQVPAVQFNQEGGIDYGKGKKSKRD
jgi:hypothetical protein